MKIRILAICMFVFLASDNLYAENYAGEFMALGGGARAMAMGGAFVSIANDATAPYWNPAGISFFSSFITKPENIGISMMHSERFGNLLDYNYLSVVRPIEGGKSGWGFTFIHLGVPDIRIIPMNSGMMDDVDGDGIYEPLDGDKLNFNYKDYPFESANDYALFFSYAQKMDFASLGASVKLIRNDQVAGFSSLGIGIDLGLLKKNLWKDAMLGIKLQDATGTYISWSTGKEEFIYPTLKIGVGYPFRIESMNSVLFLAVDGDLRFSNRRQGAQFWLGRASADFHLGAELFIRELVALRGGLDMGRPTAGAGFLLEDFGNWNISLGFDYALLVHDVFDTTHRVSMLISF